MTQVDLRKSTKYFYIIEEKTLIILSFFDYKIREHTGTEYCQQLSYYNNHEPKSVIRS